MTTASQDKPGFTLRTDVEHDANTFFETRDKQKEVKRAWQLGLVVLEQEMDSYFWRAVFAEGLATLFFLFAVVTTLCGNQSNPTSVVDSDTQILIVLVFGVTIFICVYFLAGISGGNINPAVSFGLMLGKRISVVRAACYIIAQCIGAIIGTAFAKATVGTELFDAAAGAANVLSVGVSSGQAMCGEIICTAALTLSVLVGLSGELWVLMPKSKIHMLLPLVVGSTVAVCHMILVPIDGTSVNPARSLGPAILAGQWSSHWVFWIGPLVGAAIGVFLWEAVIRPPQVVVTDAAGREHDVEADGNGEVTDKHKHSGLMKRAGFA